MLASRQLQPSGEDGEGRSSMHQVFTPDELRRLRTLGVLSGASQDQVDRFVDPSLTMEDDGDDDDYEDPEEYQNSEVYDYDEDYLPSPPHTRTSGKWFHPPKEPTKEGLELLMGGEYGRIGHQLKSRNQMNSLYKTLSTSRSRVRPSPQEDIAAVSSQPPSQARKSTVHFQDLLPNSNGVAVASYAANAYVGQYSSGRYLHLCLIGNEYKQLPQIHPSIIHVSEVCCEGIVS